MRRDQGGLYHGRILLPHNYPMKPPNIVFLTPNGRFEVGMKICLTVSAHHPETWQPSWSIRTVLTAIIGFMPSPGGGAIGSIDYPRETRQTMARESRAWRCETCGKTNLEQLPDEDPEERLSESGSDLSTSVGALVEEQARFPIDTIRIDKIEKLDDSTGGTLDSPSEQMRKRVVKKDPTKEDAALQEKKDGKKTDGLKNSSSSNNNNNNQAVDRNVRPAAPEPRRQVAAAAPAAPAASGLLDIGIAAVFFLILWIVMQKVGI